MKPKFTDSTRYPNGYRRAVETDVRATFRRIEREQKAKADQEAAAIAAQAARDAANAAEAHTKTIPLPRKVSRG